MSDVKHGCWSNGPGNWHLWAVFGHLGGRQMKAPVSSIWPQSCPLPEHYGRSLTIIRVPGSFPGRICASLQPVGGLVTVQVASTPCGARGFLFSSSCSLSLTFLAGSWCKEAFEEAQCPKPLDARQARWSFREYKPELLLHIFQKVQVFGCVLSVLKGC